MPLTNESPFNELKHELDKTKRQLLLVSRILGGVVVALIILIYVLYDAYKNGVDMVQARCFAVRDRKNNCRGSAVLKVNENGPILIFYDDLVQYRAQFGLETNGAYLSMYDEVDENGKVATRVLLEVNEKGSGLILHDAKEKVQSVLGADKDGPILSLFEANKDASILLGLGTNRNMPCLIMSGSNKTIWKAP